MRLRLLMVAALLLLPVFAHAQSQVTVTVSWEANPEPDVVGYRVYRSELDGVFSLPALTGTNLVNGLSFDDTTAQQSRTYYYAVTAINSAGLESPKSSTISITTPSPEPPTPPAPPTIHVTVDGIQVAEGLGPVLTFDLVEPKQTPPRDVTKLVEVTLQ